MLLQMEEASDDSALRVVCLEGVDLSLEAGYTKPMTSITMAGKTELMNILMFHYTLYRTKAVLDQLKTGLAVLGVLDAMSKYSNILEPFFVCGKAAPLTAGKSAYCFGYVPLSVLQIPPP